MLLCRLRCFKGQGSNALCQVGFALAVLCNARRSFCQKGAAPLCQMRGQQACSAAFSRDFVGVDDKQDLALLNPVAFFDSLLKQHP